MKKIVFVFVLTFFLFFSQKTFAHDISITPTPIQKVQYELPYPGLLPDNPLHYLKVVRDKMIAFFISDPLKKSEFDLLQADKRLNAGAYLFAKGKEKYSLALETVSKGENYFHSAIVNAELAKKQGIDTKESFSKLNNSLKKHEEVINDMKTNTSGSLKQGFENELKRVKFFQEKVKSLSPN